MEIKLDRKKNHIAASDYKEQITVIKTTSDFKIGNNVDTNKIEGNYMVKREKETLIKIIELSRILQNLVEGTCPPARLELLLIFFSPHPYRFI